MTSLEDKYGNWLFFIPINGLTLTKSVNNEIQVNRVTFISKEKIPRVRIRLGLPYRFSELATQYNKSVRDIAGNYFKNSETYAIIRLKGKPKEKEKDSIRIIREELNILAFSQLGYTRRRFTRRLNIKSGQHGGLYQSVFLNADQNEFRLSNQMQFSPVPLVLDSSWLEFHKRFFYFNLLKIIRDEISVQKQWRTTLHRASMFAGQSQNTNDISSAFLWNIITLEMLLGDRSEQTISKSLIERSEYLLGWEKSWEELDYPNRIEKLYKIRSDYVHNGKTKAITVEDLLFSDDLIFNIINNLIRCRTFIQCKEDLIIQTKKYQAEKTLGLKHKSRFKRMEFIRKTYSEEDLKEM